MWRIETFESLSTAKLYAILKIRVNVFVVEQNCPYPELDDYDQQAKHVFYSENGEIVCYARIVPGGTKYPDKSIGRVLVHQNYRKVGWATKLMQRCLEICEEDNADEAIQLQAQAHLQSFYGSFGFIPVSEVYDEDGIPHVDMVRK